MAPATAPYSIEERIVCGVTLWVAIRARGTEWSWLTPEEAVAIGRAWLEKYDRIEKAAGRVSGITTPPPGSATTPLGWKE
ncbi:MAG TPA: hypothetical protein VE690_14895 [Rhodopila sp.]|nr:hypothetical protein [Rhodopila sp.]